MKTISKYQIGEEIGRSAAGATCRARDPFRNREYVLKILSPLAALSAPSRDRLYRDLSLSWELSHRHIAKVQDIGEVEGIVYIATELLAGSSLMSFLAAEPRTLREKLTVAAQLCEGLAYARAHGIAHGNVKPNNIFITDTGNAVLLNFGTGVWQALLLAEGARLNGLLPNYFAPEQILGEPFDGRSDIFSAGVVLYEILTGQYPFQAAPGVIPREIVHAQPQPLSQWDAQIPEELEQIVFRALNKDPQERFQTADELAANLYQIAQRFRREPRRAADHTATVDYDSASTVETLAAGIPAPAEEALAPVAEVIVAPEPVAPTPLEPVPTAPLVLPAPSASAHVALARRPARGLSHPRMNPKRRLVTFGMGAVMALAMVGVIVVRQNSAAPRNAHQAAAQTAPKQGEMPVVLQESEKPTAFTAPVNPARPAQPTPAQPTPAQPAAEQILRGQVRPLWEAGQYAKAMKLVDEVLADNPANAEAQGWKRRIRDAQEAEAEIR